MNRKFYAIILLIAITATTISCNKTHNDTPGLSQDIQNFVPQSVIDSMRVWGLTINEGTTPPNITGIYNFSRNYCTFDNSGDNRANTYFSDYHFRFHDQNNTNLTIALDYKALRSADTASGLGSFIVGAGNNFTVFVDVKGVESGISYENISIYSGTKTDNGIQNFQFGFYLKQKGEDPGNLLAKTGTSRIFKDEDGFSELTTVY